MAKKIEKPAPKSTARPTPKPLLRLKPSPLDLARSPNFDAAIAQQNYDNFIADQQARIAAQQGQFTQGRLMGAPTDQPIPPGGGLGGLTADEVGITMDQRKILDDLMARQQVDISANEAKRQDFLKTQKPIGGSMAGPIYGSLAGNILANGAPANMSLDQLNAMRMQQYNQFLSQGMQNSNTLNQDAMTNFANMQAGIESTQPATATTPKPAMPVAGMGMQKSSPAPRKFSIANNPSAKAF